MMYSTDFLTKQYNEIKKLKKALGINKNTEAGKTLLFDIAHSHNLQEIFFLKFIIECLKTIPKKIDKQFELLAQTEGTPDYFKIYKKTEILFKTNKDYIKLYKMIAKEAGFNAVKKSRYFMNMLIFEAAYSEINDKSIFSSRNPVINLYLLKKWLKKHEDDAPYALTKEETAVLNLYLSGLSIDDINEINPLDCSSREIQRIIEYNLPLKFNTGSIIQVLSLYLYNTFPHKAKKGTVSI